MPDGPSKREVRMFKVTVETQYGKHTVELLQHNVLRNEALNAIQQALEAIGYRFETKLKDEMEKS